MKAGVKRYVLLLLLVLALGLRRIVVEEFSQVRKGRPLFRASVPTAQHHFVHSFRAVSTTLQGSWTRHSIAGLDTFQRRCIVHTC